MLVLMSSPTIASGDNDLLARIAQLEGLLAAAAVLHGVDKGAKAGLQDALAYSESIVDTVREPLLVFRRADSGRIGVAWSPLLAIQLQHGSRGSG